MGDLSGDRVGCNYYRGILDGIRLTPAILLLHHHHETCSGAVLLYEHWVWWGMVIAILSKNYWSLPVLRRLHSQHLSASLSVWYSFHYSLSILPLTLIFLCHPVVARGKSCVSHITEAWSLFLPSIYKSWFTSLTTSVFPWRTLKWVPPVMYPFLL